MIKRVISTAMLGLSMLLVSTPAMAQIYQSVDPNAPYYIPPILPTPTHTDNRGSNINYVPQGQNGGVQGWANTSGTNSPAKFNGGQKPFIPTANGGNSGAPTSAPFGQSFYAPGNLAGKTQGGPYLPKTSLEGFVNGQDEIFGDEGTSGPPPLSDFGYLEGTSIGGMTTGHPSGAPSAWGFPQ